MASVWAKSFANLSVPTLFFLLLICLPPGGGQKKKEVTLQPFLMQFSANIIVSNERGVQVETAGVSVKLVRVS